MAFRSELKSLALPISRAWLHDEWIGLIAAANSRVIASPDVLMSYRLHQSNQVGVLGLSASERTRASLGRPRQTFLERADAFVVLRHRLAELFPQRTELLASVDQKIDHFRVRGSLPDSRLRRIPGILEELITRRYSRYSGSILGSLRDLLAGS